MTRRALAVLSLVLALASPPARAQSTLTLAQSGGGIGETATFTLTGGANRVYVLWFDLIERDTTIAPGVVAHVGFDLLNLSLLIPGFVGKLDAAGTNSITVNVPNDPSLAGLVLSFEGAELAPIDATSNLTRLTLQMPGTFQPTLFPPVLPVATGLAIPAADGTVTIVDTTLPIVQRYTPALEQFDFDEISCATGLLSTFTALPDGRVLVTGGLDPSTGQPRTTALLFDPATDTCSSFDMATPRAGHAAAVDGNGEVLISGGFTALDFNDVTTLFTGITNTTEIFDPVAGAFRAGPNLLEPKALHSATTTKDGRVLVAGGLTLVPILNVPFVSPTAYIYDYKGNFFGFPLLMSEGRILHGATLLDDKTVLLVGGVNVDFTTFLQTGNLADLSLSSIATGDLWKDGFLGGSFTSVTGMQTGRALPAVVATPGAQALVAGGFDLEITGSDPTKWVFNLSRSADVYASKSFTATGDMTTPRVAPPGLLLPDGTVLLIGGFAPGAEIWQR